MKHAGLLVAVLLTLVVALTPRTVLAQHDSLVKAPRLKLHPAIRYSLANGLSVVLEEDHRLPRVAVHVSYRVGLLDDPPGYASLSHLVEHLTFRGSRHVPAPGSLALLKRLGATTVQGSTGLLETDYYCVLAAEQLENALWIESDRMAFALEKIDKASLELERAIVSQELRLKQRSARPYFGHLLRAVFPAGYAYHVQNSELDDLKGIQLRHVQRFMQEYYRPDNATLVVVGDFNSAHTKALIARYFGPIVSPRLPLRRAIPATIELPGLKRLLVSIPAREEHMTFVWLGPKITGVDAHSRALAVGFLIKRLQRRLVETSALAGSVASDFEPLGSQALTIVDVALSEKADPYRVENIVAEELARLHAQPIGDVELAAHRNQQLTYRVSSLQSIAYRALAASGDGPFDAAKQLRELRAVSPKTVLAAARRYLSQKRRLIAYFRSSAEAPLGGSVIYEGLAE